MDVRLSRRPLLKPPFPPVSPANCVNGKATAAFANFAAAATKAKAQPQQKLHKCIYIYIYLSDGRACIAVTCSMVQQNGEAKKISETKSTKKHQEQQGSSRLKSLEYTFRINI
uniref:MIP29125p n=1 Tax=Drosophila melanogaster TaxID=7227 RepID=F3YDB0_DROME|nr:MIP29125p [Drosophila melanogaster]